ncbi:PKHD-type hydroxylase YbiX [BD1-7 clade bacterium]|uniref:PKHD-type hydroxylase YbiX n=1 Tax=BD1-7 clade bacterium TaxID=2029982 RepID=A0A5S9PHP7_9GAMM|nr:PKHD-type hydroxylase YbiX [BD1-7 clade bacterium]CAA0103608.1 PKHD-type hydroxylase YbiX [BD1-7 clade bacterium]
MEKQHKVSQPLEEPLTGNVPMDDAPEKFLRCLTLESGITAAQRAELIERIKTNWRDAAVSGCNDAGINKALRSTRLQWLLPEEFPDLYQQLWQLSEEANRHFQLSVHGMSTPLQLAWYSAETQDHFCWHTDIGPQLWHRKISLSIPLSGESDYEGGDLEFMFSEKIHRPTQTAGQAIIFPSFALHRVTPVTRGERIALVGWISGDEWR